jgi:hypothetical protein
MDTEGLRKHGEEQFREVARAWTEVEASIASLSSSATAGLALKVAKAGDTMTGNLSVSPASGPANVTVSGQTGPHHGYFVANKGPGAFVAGLLGMANNLSRWFLVLGNSVTESGGNAGSDFALSSYDDAGSPIENVLSFTRSTGLGTVKGNPTAALGIATKQYVDTIMTGLVPTTSNVTISNASPAVITWTSHGLSLGATIFFETTGTLPTGLTAAVKSVGSPISARNYKSNPTLYYVIPTGANTFNVATSAANAAAGTAVNTSSAGSGTHTAFANALAGAGMIGELVWNVIEVTVPVAITTATPATWNSISLSAGLWELGGNVGFIGTSGVVTFSTWHSNMGFGLGTSLSSSPYDGIDAAHIGTNDPSGIVLPFTPNQVILTGTTTINANGQAAFTGGNAGIYGKIFGRRIRWPRAHRPTWVEDP